MQKAICLLVLLILISGCLAEREQRGYWSEEAYSVTKIEDDVLKVTVREDTSTRSAEVGDLSLVRCADAAREHGFTYFTFIDKRSLVIQCFKEKPKSTTEVVYDAEQLGSKSIEKAKE